MLINAFFDSQFSYCPLILMFINRGTNRKINRLQERSLRILYQDDISMFEELLQRDNSVTVHTRNIQRLATEMYKVYNNISLGFISEIFPKSNTTHNLRSQNDFVIPKVNTVLWGSETLRILGPKIWNMLPLDIKESQHLESFKSKIKFWSPDNCPCRLCAPYISGIGFL